VVGNRSFNNGVGGPEGFGFLFRDSTQGVVRDNSATDNCVGFMFADTRFNLDVPLKDWRVVENSARHNNGTCTGEAPFLPVTAGIGFLLLGRSTSPWRRTSLAVTAPGARLAPMATSPAESS
jgi:hypothetical protein